MIEPRNCRFGVPTRSLYVEGNIVGGVMRESSGDPAGSKSHGMYAKRNWLGARDRVPRIGRVGDPGVALGERDENVKLA